ncbi:C40 family peptidase [Fibrobacter sp. UWP2]|uniref:C40 family peptidase n=1 Tax=Fibrobacter sp. UWP2 TaxID=1896216 RepID=UPI000921B606|nr:NlpC/P60 family protein [Fibrobacter sp. UWP2]SHJ44294.1 NlpC/P60 family protein [Fibrobacter sp. UWP2]
MTIADYALKFVGRPYIWGGDGSGKCSGGFDCSGLVLECLLAFGIIPQIDLTAQGIYDILYNQLIWSSVERGKEKPDDILFFGKDLKHITHVAIAIGNGLMVEAGGGGSKCKTAATSTGMVRVRPISWRKDLVAALRE